MLHDMPIANPTDLDAGALSRGWLHGIPQAIKDTGQTEGFPTTFGCSLLKDAVAPRDGLMAGRMKAVGCIVVGKPATPAELHKLHTAEIARYQGIARAINVQPQ